MTLVDNMPHRCTVRILYPTQDSLGGMSLVPTNVNTNVECWEQKATHDEIVEFQKRGILKVRKIYFNSDPSVDEGYEILITSRDRGVTTISSPIVLKVISVAGPDASAGLGVVYKVMCADQTGDE